MDGHRFDEFARVFATGTSRRRVLGLVGAGIASIGTHLTRRNASAGCLGYGSDCTEFACCEGFVCDESNTCDYECANIGEFCGFVPTGGGPEVVCCTGFCNQQGICEEDVPVCGGEGDLCFAREAGLGFNCCQDGLECIDGTCQFPEPECGDEGDYCGPKSNECCNEGLECIEDFCAIPPCGEVGDTELECCDGLICLDGACAEPEPLCSAEGEPCKDDTGCCDDLICGDSGTCEVIEDTCLLEGETCETDDECCDGICCAGACRAIECCIDEPNPNDRCPEGTSCFEGICEGVAEFCEDDSTCGTGTCCCDDGSCSEDCCDPPVDEEEPVTQLPNTGIGDESAGRSAWIGAAALGAAAAFLGGKRLKPTGQAAADE